MAKASVLLKCVYCGAEFRHEKNCFSRNDEIWREAIQDASDYYKKMYAPYWTVLHTDSAKFIIDNRR